jgi:hypothetical protein
VRHTRCSDCASVSEGLTVYTARRTARRTARHCVHGMCESRGHTRRVADDSHARDHRRSAPSEVGAVGPCVEDVVWLLCPAVRAGVRGTVRDRPMLPASATRVRCSIRLVRTYSREGCLHGTAIGSHQLPVFAKSTILTPLPESRPHSGGFGAGLGSMSNEQLGARLRVDPCEPGSGLHQIVSGRAPTRRFTDLTFSRPYFCVHGGWEMTEVKNQALRGPRTTTLGLKLPRVGQDNSDCAEAKCREAHNLQSLC